MIRRLSALPLAFAAVLILAATVAAGGWATATLDPGTTGPQAGTPVTLGFRVLQHGQTPNSTLNVVVHAAGAAGGSVVADATHQGESGHYVATLTFPTDGAWTITWTSELDMAGSSAVLKVVPAGAAPVGAAPAAADAVVSPTPVAPTGGTEALALIVVGVALAVAVVGGVVVLRRRRAGTSVPSAG